MKASKSKINKIALQIAAEEIEDLKTRIEKLKDPEFRTSMTIQFGDDHGPLKVADHIYKMLKEADTYKEET